MSGKPSLARFGFCLTTTRQPEGARRIDRAMIRETVEPRRTWHGYAIRLGRTFAVCIGRKR